jgi:6-phosphogluconolactonase
MASPHLIVEVDAASAARAAARLIGEALDGAIAARGRASVAFSGGSTPVAMFEQLADLPLRWDRVDVFQVDERVAPDGDPARNAVALQHALLDRVAARAHFMDVTASGLDDAARRYAATLAPHEPLDVVHLGVGDDGHTASWPPHHPVIDQRDRAVAIVGPFNDFVRMTVTPPVVDRARTVVFLVGGAAKAHALDRLLARDPEVPATRAIGSRTVVVADRAARPAVTN